mmetsp:Transcript_25365/g.38987  ORF Transcript_25365/g.38987 Transcript_25365/m.38987 type:complete len:118 (-) Transcript_25365:235-588(-)
MACFFTELAVCDYAFVGQRPSVIAIASILNALEVSAKEQCMDRIHSIANMMHIHMHGGDVARTRGRLWDLYERSEEFAVRPCGAETQSSPRSVRKGSSVVRNSKAEVSSSPVSVCEK